MSDPISDLTQAGEDYATFLEGLSEEDYRRRPTPDDWSNVELAGHVAQHPRRDLAARHAWHGIIEDDEVRPFVGEGLEAPRPVGGLAHRIAIVA